MTGSTCPICTWENQSRSTRHPTTALLWTAGHQTPSCGPSTHALPSSTLSARWVWGSNKRNLERQANSSGVISLFVAFVFNVSLFHCVGPAEWNIQSPSASLGFICQTISILFFVFASVKHSWPLLTIRLEAISKYQLVKPSFWIYICLSVSYIFGAKFICVLTPLKSMI